LVFELLKILIFIEDTGLFQMYNIHYETTLVLLENQYFEWLKNLSKMFLLVNVFFANFRGGGLFVRGRSHLVRGRSHLVRGRSHLVRGRSHKMSGKVLIGGCTWKNVEKFCFSPKFFVFLRSLYCHFDKNPIFLRKRQDFCLMIIPSM
jgi:hypothetical protein